MSEHPSAAGSVRRVGNCAPSGQLEPTTHAETDHSRTILLTGSQGRIGTALRRLLPELGWRLRTFDRADGADVVGELTDAGALDAAMAGIEAVVHLAGKPTEAPWPTIHESNIERLGGSAVTPEAVCRNQRAQHLLVVGMNDDRRFHAPYLGAELDCGKALSVPTALRFR